jgi:hypothetical protein
MIPNRRRQDAGRVGSASGGAHISTPAARISVVPLLGARAANSANHKFRDLSSWSPRPDYSYSDHERAILAIGDGLSSACNRHLYEPSAHSHRGSGAESERLAVVVVVVVALGTTAWSLREPWMCAIVYGLRDRGCNCHAPAQGGTVFHEHPGQPICRTGSHCVFVRERRSRSAPLLVRTIFRSRARMRWWRSVRTPSLKGGAGPAGLLAGRPAGLAKLNDLRETLTR